MLRCVLLVPIVMAISGCGLPPKLVGLQSPTVHEFDDDESINEERDSGANNAEVLRRIKPIDYWTGTDSDVPVMSFERHLTAASFEDSWRATFPNLKTRPTPPCPKVDFDSNMVIAIFQGRSRHNKGIWLVETLEEKDTIHIRYRPHSYQCAGTPENIDESFKPTFSYGFLVLPISSKAIVLEEDAGNVYRPPPKWTKRSEFSQISDK